MEVTVPAKGKAVVKTGLAIAVPDGCYGRIAPRSGLAVRNHIDIGAGVIDAVYGGEVGVVMFNHSDENFKMRPGDRIAQLILEQSKTPPVKDVSELDSTVCGSSGYGSTGMSSDREKAEQDACQVSKEQKNVPMSTKSDCPSRTSVWRRVQGKTVKQTRGPAQDKREFVNTRKIQ